jgi:opacity protein-like surface antigen
MGRVISGAIFASAFLVALSAGGVRAADLPVKVAPAPAPVWSWSGWYVGLNVGATWGTFNPRTSTAVDGFTPLTDASDVAAVNAAGVQTINAFGATGGSQVGFNWQNGNFVFGVEADSEYMHLAHDKITPGSYPGIAGCASGPGGLCSFDVHSYGNANWLFTLRPRVGFVGANNTLWYVTAGLAITDLNGTWTFVDNTGLSNATGSQVSAWKAGYAVGGGVEAKLRSNWSIKAEYLYVSFPSISVSDNLLTGSPGQVFNHSIDLNASLFRVGLNYHFGMPDDGPGVVSASLLPVKAPRLAPILSDWSFDFGTRTWFSTGRVGAPAPLNGGAAAPGVDLLSRLIYYDENAVSGEVFARADRSNGLFVKGYVGAGAITSGHMNNEDFPGGNAYSNTLEPNGTGNSLEYLTVDAGYTFLKRPGARLGAFVGYNYFYENINTNNCIQLAAATGCSSPANAMVPTNGVSEEDWISSLRVGLTGQFALNERLSLSTEAVWVPYAYFEGINNHNNRLLQITEGHSSGDGVMLEAILSYKVTPKWSVGIGGRYWAWNIPSGISGFNNVVPSTNFSGTEGGHYFAERYGVFAQASYHWGDPDATAVAPAGLYKAPPMVAWAPNWTGAYIGGHFGGGVGDDRWSDPFGTNFLAPPGPGGANIAGFGDTIHAMGPLGGGQIGVNFQSGKTVFGIEASASGANIRGENTCFSGLGGVNCERIVNFLGTVTGRVGWTWDRSLLYVKGGGAWANTKYNIDGQTSFYTLGTGSTTITQGGWTIGGGLEYAIDQSWSARFEYDYLGFGSTGVSFPTVAVVGAPPAPLTVSQNINVFEFGVNYKLGVLPLATRY